MTEDFIGQDFDRDRFEEDPQYRWDYLTEFLDFEKSDWEILQSTEHILAPKIPDIVGDLYEHFLEFEPTADLYRNENEDIDDGLIEDRIEGFELWFQRIFDCEDRQAYVTYLAKVGEIHTGEMGFERMVVDETQMGPTFAWLVDRIGEELTTELSDPERLADCLSAWQRFFSLQLSLFGMAYSSDSG